MHPDDPPRNILGLPRIVSNAADIAWILGAVDDNANGITLCSGSLGAHADNDVPEIARQFADRIHFAHLRNVKKEADGSFQEASHLAGDTDMVALIGILLDEESRRKQAGQGDDIVFGRIMAMSCCPISGAARTQAIRLSGACAGLRNCAVSSMRCLMGGSDDKDAAVFGYW